MKTNIAATFSNGLIFGGGKCLHATSQRRVVSHAISLIHAISLTVNYRLVAHIEVSYRFNGANDNVVLESADIVKPE